MDDCEKFGEEERRVDEKFDRKHFWRQLLICSGVWTSYFVYGLIAGAPTVLIPQIRREANSTEALNEDMTSWLSSAYNFSGFPCVLVLSIFTWFFGRKIAFVLACLDTFIAFLVFYYSTSVVQILVSEIMQGLFSAAQVVISIMILTEYSSPKYRGLFLTIKSATFNWGIWAANVLGTFFHWKNIGLFGILCAVYALTIVFIWPESPYWLASKERYKECAASHRWLKGHDEESEKELETMIYTQKEYIKSCRREKLSGVETITNWFSIVTSKEFYKPTLISILTGFLAISSGKLVCTVYAIDILKKITDNESTAYTGMLILDGITIASMYVGCVLSKYLSRRVLLLVASAIGAITLYTISLYLYLIHLSVFTENKYVSLGLLTSFSIAISCGPMVMSTAVYGELIPVRSRNLATCLIALVCKLSLGLVLKAAPYMFKALGLHGTFLFFGISSSICISLLYKYLPETKNKTLQEIADCIKGVSPLNLKSLKEGVYLTDSKI